MWLNRAFLVFVISSLIEGLIHVAIWDILGTNLLIFFKILSRCYHNFISFNFNFFGNKVVWAWHKTVHFDFFYYLRLLTIGLFKLNGGIFAGVSFTFMIELFFYYGFSCLMFWNTVCFVLLYLLCWYWYLIRLNFLKVLIITQSLRLSFFWGTILALVFLNLRHFAYLFGFRFD